MWNGFSASERPQLDLPGKRNVAAQEAIALANAAIALVKKLEQGAIEADDALSQLRRAHRTLLERSVASVTL